MHAVKITQVVTHDGITIPFKAVRRFQGKRVEILIFPESDEDQASRAGVSPLRAALDEVFAQYHDVRPYSRIDPLQWEKEIRDEW